MLTRGARPFRTRELHLVRGAIRMAVDANEVIQKAAYGAAVATGSAAHRNASGDKRNGE
jgi:hypothetical protein